MRSGYREAFFLGWSLLDIAIICLLAYLDGGVTSPATLALFLTQVFAALSYPIGSMIAVAVASLIGVAVLGAAGGAAPAHLQADPIYVTMFLVCRRRAAPARRRRPVRGQGAPAKLIP